ncbi:hypothetical protein ACLB2K_055818 [Fragaria x ananassa]
MPNNLSRLVLLKLDPTSFLFFADSDSDKDYGSRKRRKDRKATSQSPSASSRFVSTSVVMPNQEAENDLKQ